MDRSQVLNDAEQSLRIALDGQQAGLWTALPGIVQSVNWTALTCVVQPAIQGVVTSSEGVEAVVNLPTLLDVPILFPSGGGFALTLPLAQGDEVLIIFASRCIDSWWQNGGYQNPPIEIRMHDLSDGFAFPAQMSQAQIKALNYAPSSTTARLGDVAGDTYVEIAPGKIVNIVAPSGINITGPLQIDGAINVTGDLAVTGSLSATEEISSGLEVIAQTTVTPIPLSTHIHPVTTAPGDTGAPTP